MRLVLEFNEDEKDDRKLYHAVLLPALLLEHDDPVGALVEGRRQSVPLRVQSLDPSLQIQLALRHYCDLIPARKKR